MVGGWLVISNWVINYPVPDAAPATLADVIFWNSTIAGALAIALGIIAVATFDLWEEMLDLAIGTWLIASPWFLDFTTVSTAFWNVVICGAILIASAVWTIVEERGARST